MQYETISPWSPFNDFKFGPPIPKKRKEIDLEPIYHPTEYDESDDLEDAKRVKPPQPEKTYQPFNGGKGG